MRLKNSDGEVIEVNDSSCYSPTKDGDIMCALGGFSYFMGKVTDEPVTHKISNDLSESLVTRGRLVKISS